MSAVSPRRPMLWRDMDLMLATVGTEVRAFVAEQIGPLVVRLAAAEHELAALRDNPPTLADAFKGVWMPGTVFKRGSLVIWDGSPWLSMVDTETKPGSSSDWKLFAKRGRDGKDGKDLRG